ncbi:alkaline phosphatase, tissue-nonspecific isozyme-like [Oratosquilla oratoria]|uniref:alkaline phosphatase, tissue-nonspecific isozyme-like n=1 Tax=Oratosquilla oratoria TaxID=337810 RepID=UPI003F76126A
MDASILCQSRDSRGANQRSFRHVLLGGGRRHWIPEGVSDKEGRNQQGRRTDGRNLVDDWVKDKKSRDLHAEYVWSKSQFDNVDHRYTDYLLGLFGYSHLDFEMDRNKGPSGDPSLSEMTTKAIQILRKNPHGFFLMVEAGRLDHAHHYNMAGRALDEVTRLEECVEAALKLTDPRTTLLVVTADHSHTLTFGGAIVPRGNSILGFDSDVSDLDSKPYTTLLYGNGPGYSHATPQGREDISGANFKDINFIQQAAVPRKYETHGGEDVPVYATGPSSYLFSGTIEQTYIAHAIAYAACMADDNSHCEKPPKDDACASGGGGGGGGGGGHGNGRDLYGAALYPRPQLPLGISSSDVEEQKRHKPQWAWSSASSVAPRGGWWSTFFLLKPLVLPLLLLPVVALR